MACIVLIVAPRPRIVTIVIIADASFHSGFVGGSGVNSRGVDRRGGSPWCHRKDETQRLKETNSLGVEEGGIASIKNDSELVKRYQLGSAGIICVTDLVGEKQTRPISSNETLSPEMQVIIALRCLEAGKMQGAARMTLVLLADDQQNHHHAVTVMDAPL